MSRPSPFTNPSFRTAYARATRANQARAASQLPRATPAPPATPPAEPTRQPGRKTVDTRSTYNWHHHSHNSTVHPHPGPE